MTGWDKGGKGNKTIWIGGNKTPSSMGTKKAVTQKGQVEERFRWRKMKMKKRREYLEKNEVRDERQN